MTHKHNVTLTHGRDEYGQHFTWSCSCGQTETGRARFRGHNRAAASRHVAGRGSVTDAGYSEEVPPAYLPAREG
jgi:hypothetical protein